MFYWATLLTSIILAAYIAYNPSLHPIKKEASSFQATLRDQLPTHITLFIHGATHVPLVLLSPSRVYQRQLDGTSWYEQVQGAIRGDADTRKNTFMVDLGLIDITEEIVAETLDDLARHQAAYHIVRAFNRMSNTAPSTTQKRFFTFGWSGLISNSTHEQDAEQLYEHIIRLKKIYTDHNIPLCLELYCYSYGGQIALRLAHIQRTRGDEPLNLDLLVLSGVPLHHHNTRDMFSGTFKTIINIYSIGDMIQTMDSVIEPSGTTFRTIAEATPIPTHQTSTARIIDLSLTIHEQPIIGHQAFFNLHSLPIPLTRKRRSQRYLQRYQGAIGLHDTLQSLPLLVLYPQIVPTLCQNITGYAHIQMDLSALEPGIICARYTTTYPHTSDLSSQMITISTASLARSHAEIDAAYADTSSPTLLTHITQEAHRAFSTMFHGSEPHI